jgi:carboxypeptidase C (cathepsin A)
MQQSRLKADVRARISEKLYQGGHMFYSWHDQRKRFSDDVKAFIQSFE